MQDALISMFGGRAAEELVKAVRAAPASHWGIDAFLHEYALSSREGVVLMCLAEALLRIPDSETADRLSRDKLENDLGPSLVNMVRNVQIDLNGR